MKMDRLEKIELSMSLFSASKLLSRGKTCESLTMEDKDLSFSKRPSTVLAQGGQSSLEGWYGVVCEQVERAHTHRMRQEELFVLL